MITLVLSRDALSHLSDKPTIRPGDGIQAGKRLIEFSRCFVATADTGQTDSIPL